MADIYYKLDKKTRDDLVETFKRVAVEILEGPKETWLPEYNKPYYRELYKFIKDEYSKNVVYPPSEDIFNALHYTPLSNVKVVILGQDPYHEPNQ